MGGVETNPEDIQAVVALAARCEAATGPDRELDLAIHRAVGRAEEMNRIIDSGRRGLDGEEGRAWDIQRGALIYEVRNTNGVCWANGGIPLPAYTASLDAAMTLVPEGWWLQHLGHIIGGWCCRVETNGPPSCSIGVGFRREQRIPTPALALCAAALRARAAILSGEAG